MDGFGNGYEHYQQQSHQQQQLNQQQTIQADLTADAYDPQLFSDPRYQVPPSFLDDPPRGPDPLSGYISGPSPYLSSSQDPAAAAWDAYAAASAPVTYAPPPGPSSYYAPQQSITQSYDMQYTQSYTTLDDPASDELANFPTMSLGPNAPQQQQQQVAIPVPPPQSAPLPLTVPPQPQSDPSLVEPPQNNNPAPQRGAAAGPGQQSTPYSNPNGVQFYSSSGFDMIGVLTRVAARKNPQVVLGPVDFTCSFVVSDATQEDEPIVYASPTFSELTGYELSEIVGRNCRFLQSPTGRIRKGETRRFTDDKGVAHIRKSIDNQQECQVSFINYKKSGEAFVNLVTIIPIPWDSEEIRYLIGFQVDLERQPGAIVKRMGDGSYAVNYSTSADPFPPMSDKLRTVLKLGEKAEDARAKFNDFILEHSDDFIHVVSLKGAFQYVSPSVTAVLEYTPSELLGKSISDIAHPSDVVPVMRELKESTAQAQPPSLISSSSLAQHYLSQAKLVHLLYRVRRKNSGYVWLECTGRLHVESSKGRKSIVFSGRIRRQPVLHWSLTTHDGVGSRGFGGIPMPTDCWAQVSVDSGIVLYVSSGVDEILGRPSKEVQGTQLRGWVAAAWRVAVDAALTEARSKLEENMRAVENGGGRGAAAAQQEDANGSLTSLVVRRAVPEKNSANAPAVVLTFFSTYTPLAAPVDANPPNSHSNQYGTGGGTGPSSRGSLPGTPQNGARTGGTISPQVSASNGRSPMRSPAPPSPQASTSPRQSNSADSSNSNSSIPTLPPPPPPPPSSAAPRRSLSVSSSATAGGRVASSRRRANSSRAPYVAPVPRGKRQATLIVHMRFPPPAPTPTPPSPSGSGSGFGSGSGDGMTQPLQSSPPPNQNVQDFLRPSSLLANPMSYPYAGGMGMSTPLSSSGSISPSGGVMGVTSPPGTPGAGALGPGARPNASVNQPAQNRYHNRPRSSSFPHPHSNMGLSLLTASLTSNIFEELETTRGTSWQYELQQMRMANAKLQAEIDEAMKAARSTAGPSGTGGRG